MRILTPLSIRFQSELPDQEYMSALVRALEARGVTDIMVEPDVRVFFTCRQFRLIGFPFWERVHVQVVREGTMTEFTLRFPGYNVFSFTLMVAAGAVMVGSAIQTRNPSPLIALPVLFAAPYIGLLGYAAPRLKKLKRFLLTVGPEARTARN